MVRLITVSFILCLISCSLSAQSIKPFFECTKNLQSPYGMCAHFTFTNSKGDYDTRDQQAAILHSLGCNIVRSDVLYNIVNNSNTGILDAAMSSTYNNKLGLLGIIYDFRLSKSSWANTSDFHDYVETLKSHYATKLNYVEFHNEINFSKLPHLGKRYIDDLQELQGLKKENKRLKIVFSGIADTRYDFLDSVMSIGGYKYFDIMNFHTYRTPEDIPTVMKIIADNMKKYHWSKPVWMTECGMNTAKYKLDNTDSVFFTEVVPYAVKSIGMSYRGLNIGVFNDVEHAYSSLGEHEVDVYIKKLGAKCCYIKLSQLETISPKDIPLIILAQSESFYADYFPALLSYVRKGGTIVLPYGTPFYYDTKTGKGMGQKLTNQLHVGQLYWWVDEAKRLKAPEHPTYYAPNKDFGITYSFGAVNDGLSPRYLTAHLLKGMDKMIPISYAGNDQYKGVTAALYQLDSDLKGNVIIQTRMGTRRLVDLEDEQARRVARIHLIAFAYGVDKVFWYKFRSNEQNLYYSEDNFGMVHKDLSPKPAYYAYKTLIKMLPNGSTRPSLQTGNGVYKVQWCRPDGQVVTAYWCKTGFTYVPVGLGKTIYDYMGNRVKATKVIKVSSGVTYVIE